MSQPHADLNASSSVKLSRRSHRRTLLAPGTSGIAHSWRSFAAKGNSYQGVAWMKAAYSVATPWMKRSSAVSGAPRLGENRAVRVPELADAPKEGELARPVTVEEGGVLVRAVDDVPLGQGEVRLILAPGVVLQRAELPLRGSPGGRRRLRRRVVPVPQLVPKAVVRIHAALEGEELRGARVGAAELRLGRVDLVGQVVGSAERQRRVDQLAGPDADFLAFRLGHALLVVHDERERLLLRPRQQGAGVLLGVTDRDVEHVDAMAPEDARHTRDELVEARDRDEVLLEHVGGAGA